MGITTGFNIDDLKRVRFYNFVDNTFHNIDVDLDQAITGVILQETMSGSSTLTVELTDPLRKILRQDIKQGLCFNIGSTPKRGKIPPNPGKNFPFVRYNKTSDQAQLTMESLTVYRLSQQTGTTPVTTSTAVTQFIGSLVQALNKSPTKGAQVKHVKFYAPDYATTWGKIATGAPVPIELARGTTTDPYEDSWTCMNRIASSIGWRIWEMNGDIFFGPDEYWLGRLTHRKPPVNVGMSLKPLIPVLKELTPHIPLIDFDWDVGKPFGQATVTATLDRWEYQIGEIVELKGMGKANGDWMVYAMQRNAYNPQGTLTLQVPMPFAEVFDPTALPLVNTGFPLTLKGGELVHNGSILTSSFGN